MTGAAQGIGRDVALRLAREGGSVALVDRSELVAEVRIEAEAAAPRRSPINADLETFAGATAAVEQGAGALRPHRHPGEQRRRHDLGKALRRI